MPVLLSSLIDVPAGELSGVLAADESRCCAAGLLVKVASSRAFTNVSTTGLLTVEKALEALRQGAGAEYRAPGAPGS